MKKILLSLTIVGVGTIMACRKPQHTIADLNGTWLRYESEDGRYLGLEVICTDGNCIVSDSVGGAFGLDAVKWMNFTPVANIDYDYEFEDLGSDGNYYNSTMEFLNASKDTIIINSTLPFSPGSRQKWAKQ